jgi:hypothetical protein
VSGASDGDSGRSHELEPETNEEDNRGVIRSARVTRAARFGRSLALPSHKRRSILEAILLVLVIVLVLDLLWHPGQRAKLNLCDLCGLLSKAPVPSIEPLFPPLFGVYLPGTEPLFSMTRKMRAGIRWKLARCESQLALRLSLNDRK